METLIDSGAGGEFIDQNYARTLELSLQELTKPIPPLNVDGTLNKKGIIKQYLNLDLNIFGQKQTIQLLVTRLGKEKMILEQIKDLLVKPLPKPTEVFAVTLEI